MTEARPAVAVRPARRRDIPIIVRMAADLSRHEGDPADQFDAAAATADLFGARRWIRGLVAALEDQPAGMALWYPCYETAYAARGGYIVSLWVDEPFRRRGVATALVGAAVSEVKRIGGDYLWWASKPGNARARATYAALGAWSEETIAHVLFGEPFHAATGRTAMGGSPAFGP